MPDVRFEDLCIDVTSVGDRPRRVAEFWGRLLGQEVVERADGPFVLEPPPGGPDERRVRIDEVPPNPVPEPKQARNRVHWDVTLADGTVDGLLRAGARLLREPDETDEWWVLADPEGNEFCAFAASI
ncbi:MAG: hypothetical protein KatS3mg010_1694 [Acidimicrobiia bacterium]|nr:MAG: hypothetical protein KatS3mg010_1694 [Acidimicrobiia bacterium]